MMLDSDRGDDLEHENPPRKKVKITDSTIGSYSEVGATLDLTSREHFITLYEQGQKEQTLKEQTVGIEAFVSNNTGFHGLLKSRFHDFLVNEITPAGQVLHLHDPAQLKLSESLAASINGHEKNPDNFTNGSFRNNGNTSESCSTKTKLDRNADPEATLRVSATDDAGKEAAETEADTNPSLKEIKAIATKDIEGEIDQISIELDSQALATLQKHFEMDEIKQLASIYHSISLAPQKDPSAHGSADSMPIDDKEDRKTIHQIIRIVFRGRIESNHSEGNVLHCVAAASALIRKGKSNKNSTPYKPTDWDSLGGEYMHFSLYKENRDTSDILGYLAIKLNIKNQKIFTIAGNKDRRGVSVQRISAYRVKADRFLHLNNIISQARVGDCSYHTTQLQLGDLAGNEFVITLRDCAVRRGGSKDYTLATDEIETHIKQSMQNLQDNGFINYYGLQRFGSFATRTDIVGKYMINGDYKAAVDTILEFSPLALEAAQAEDSNETISSDDKSRAQAIHWFRTGSKDIKTILDTLPRRFTAEYAIISFLCRKKDESGLYYRGALEAIPRNNRSIYVHAYQSLIWNLAATHRWTLAPGRLLPGDLVLVNNTTSPQTTTVAPPQLPVKHDSEGDPIINPPSALQHSTSSQSSPQIHVLTELDISTNRYSIFDLVLPQPGHSIHYPSNLLPFFKSTMKENGDIDPENMRRNWRDVSLPGAYRPLLGRPGPESGVEIIWYSDEKAKIAVTDIEKLEAAAASRQTDHHDAEPPVSEFVGDGSKKKNKNKNSKEDHMKKQKQKREEDHSVPGGITIGESGIALAGHIEKGDRLAVVLKFRLESSTYATMALRELMMGGCVEFKPEFSAGRGL